MRPDDDNKTVATADLDTHADDMLRLVTDATFTYTDGRTLPTCIGPVPQVVPGPSASGARVSPGACRTSLPVALIAARGSASGRVGSRGAQRPRSGAAGALDAARERIVGRPGNGGGKVGLTGFGGAAGSFPGGWRGDRHPW